MYLSYVLVITAAHMIGAAHQVSIHYQSRKEIARRVASNCVIFLFKILQILWLIATVTQSSFLNSVAQYSVSHWLPGILPSKYVSFQYAYPNTILTFTSPIALVLMSQQVRHELLFFVTRRHIGVGIGESTVSVRVASSTWQREQAINHFLFGYILANK